MISPTNLICDFKSLQQSHKLLLEVRLLEESTEDGFQHVISDVIVPDVLVLT